MDKACKKWAIVTLHSWLPSKSEQIARARAWGVTESWLEDVDVSAIFIDDVRKVKRTTNWVPHLKERFTFMNSAAHIDAAGSGVFFATPLCVGFSEKLAQQTIDGLWAVGMHVYVHSVGAIYLPGDDLTEFLAQVGRDANAAHVRAWRSKKTEEPKDIDRRLIKFEKKPCLYRHFDKEGALLYVGSCANYTKRRYSHRNHSEWATEIHREQVEYFPTLHEAWDAERTAIWHEKPLHNKRRWAPRKVVRKPYGT